MHLLKRQSTSTANLQITSGKQNSVTPWKINMEPKNGGLEDDIPFQRLDFQVPCKFSGVLNPTILGTGNPFTAKQIHHGNIINLLLC